MGIFNFFKNKDDEFDDVAQYKKQYHKQETENNFSDETKRQFNRHNNQKSSTSDFEFIINLILGKNNDLTPQKNTGAIFIGVVTRGNVDDIKQVEINGKEYIVDKSKTIIKNKNLINFIKLFHRDNEKLTLALDNNGVALLEIRDFDIVENYKNNNVKHGDYIKGA